jgi:hypothetical protein
MPDVMLVSEVVDHLRIDLSRVQSEFERANETSYLAAEATGHLRLGLAVARFAESWDHRRVELVEQIETVRNHLEMIDTQFGNLEIELAHTFEESP